MEGEIVVRCHGGKRRLTTCLDEKENTPNATIRVKKWRAAEEI
jgi:hypothetical protein